jgi:hypothetical protein
MGGKEKPIAHKGKTSWWDGSLTTNCGQKFKAGDYRALGWLESVKGCPGCANSNAKHKH